MLAVRWNWFYINIYDHSYVVQVVNMNGCVERRSTAVSEVSDAAEIPLIPTETDPSDRTEGVNMRETGVDKNVRAKRPSSENTLKTHIHMPPRITAVCPFFLLVYEFKFLPGSSRRLDSTAVLALLHD